MLTNDKTKKNNDENIREKQYQLNNILSKDKLGGSILDENILKLSQELDELIVAHYKKKVESVN